MSLLQLLESLNSIRNFFYEFRFEKIEKAQSLRGVRLDIEKHRLSLTSETGMAIGKFARALNLRECLLQDFIQLVVLAWRMKDSQRAKKNHFIHEVRQGFEDEEDEDEEGSRSIHFLMHS